MKLLMIAAAAGVGLAGAAQAQWGGVAYPQRGWHVIGERTVNRHGDTDTIKVRGRDRTRQLMLCTVNRPIHMRDFDVRFENGGHQDVNVRERIRAGSCTRAIDLKGNRRNIDRIRLSYERGGRGWGGGAPLVRVLAR
jgi:hypothetical protein